MNLFSFFLASQVLISTALKFVYATNDAFMHSLAAATVTAAVHSNLHCFYIRFVLSLT